MRRWLLAAAVCLAGCKDLPDVCDAYPGRTCIALEVGVASTGPSAFDELGVAPIMGFDLDNSEARRQLPSGALKLPALIAVVPSQLTANDVALEVRAYQNDSLVGVAQFSGRLAPQQHLRVPLALVRPGPEPQDLSTASTGHDGGGALPDLRTPPDLTGCDPVSQTGCSGAQKCTLSLGAPVCGGNGTVGAGGACSLPDNCAAGGYCVLSTINVCRPFCATSADCPAHAPVSSLNTPLCDWPIPGTQFIACTVPCNPVSTTGASGCASGMKCDGYGASDGSGEHTDCLPQKSSAGDGASCTGNDDCDQGLGCFATPGKCRAYCRKGQNGDCRAVGYTCHNVNNWNFLGACCPSSTGC